MSVPNASLWLGLVCLGALACGARSDVRCFGGECVGGAGASTGVVDEDDEDITPPPDNPFSPPVDVTPDPPPSMEMPPNEDLPVSSGDLCPNGRRARGPIVIDRARDLSQLRGCVEVQGDLTIAGFTTRDLRQLRSLERVLGNFHLGITGSLEGLEALQHVWGLSFDGLNTETLAPLGNLGLVGTVENDPEAVLDIRNSSGFLNLSGLEGLSPIVGRVQIVANPSLQSLEGLPLGSSMDELEVRANAALLDLGSSATLVRAIRIDLESNSRLSDITALGAVAEANVLDLEGLALQSLDALQSLTVVNNLSIMENLALQDVERLSAVDFQTLRVVRNEALEGLPELAIPISIQQLQVRENPSLRTPPSFPNLSSANRIVISDSPSITHIVGFPALTRVGTLEVRDNPALVELQLGLLQSYELARIVCNESFPEASIASYLASRGGELHLRGNFGSIAPCELP